MIILIYTTSKRNSGNKTRNGLATYVHDINMLYKAALNNVLSFRF